MGDEYTAEGARGWSSDCDEANRKSLVHGVCNGANKWWQEGTMLTTCALFDAAGGDRNFGFCTSAGTSQPFDSPDNLHAVDDFAKYDMLIIKPWCYNSCNKELWSMRFKYKLSGRYRRRRKYLRTVCVGTSICHRQKTRFSVTTWEVLICRQCQPHYSQKRIWIIPANFSPYIDLPPVPLWRVKSPPCSMN